MGTDARVRYTKLAIRTSFIQLLRKKPLNRVTVKELCELSEINRATFYKHYRDAYDLLDQLEETFLEDLRQRVGEGARRDFRSTISAIMERIREDGESFQILFSENGDPHFPARVFSLFYNSFVKALPEREAHRFSPSQQKWLYYFIAQGCGSILDQWIAGGMAEPVQEVVDFMDRLVQGTLKGFSEPLSLLAPSASPAASH